MTLKLQNIVLSVCTLFIATCGKDKTTSIPASVDNGSYTVGPVHCTSTTKEPVYPSLDHKVALGVFSGSTHNITISGGVALETVSDDDCTLEVSRPILINSSEQFALSLAKTHTWSPEGCAITVTIDDSSYDIGATQAESLKDSSEQATDIPYGVKSPDTGVYTITSLDYESLNQAWAKFGCATTDHISRILTKLP